MKENGQFHIGLFSFIDIVVIFAVDRKKEGT